MQRAILLVLILIAVILAPWLLGVIAVLIAAYGLWVVVAGALSFMVVAVYLLVYFLRRRLLSRRDVSSRIEQQISEANRLHRAKDAGNGSVVAQENFAEKVESERVSKKRMTICKKCEASIEKHSMYCPQCGKSPV
ncbi:zinc ribbon domain-containing protein [Pseudomonas sp. D3]|uniref:zinc ribbon domain-containing protein n=1 Tax=Pseudomonas sp. D3 TaxID=517398 RepID=UPI0023E380A3|nr:zinc ribbon domain-containing protein [Pseudomonas sp. D3]WET11875.1 zinc ribbon domain-containing protein [Pseudomonas sp. D3]